MQSTRVFQILLPTLGLIATFIVLTAGDFATTLIALKSGNAVELNPVAARGSADIHMGFLAISNVVLLVPLAIAFAFGVAQAAHVPEQVLTHWWRHILDVFFVDPLNDAARQRRPLRLVTAAMTLLVLKIVIVASNSLVILGFQNPTSVLAAFWTGLGATGPLRYWATYAVMIVPCYVAAVGLASMVLRAAQRRSSMR